MANPEHLTQKHALRRQMRAMLRELSLDSQAACSAFHYWLISHPERRTIAVYAPLPGEVDLAPAIASHPERKWIYPRVAADHHLTFHSGEKMMPGAFGILEPAAESPEIHVEAIDAFICPGLAFDNSGGRLGRGRGFYDRMLSKARPDALKIGICHTSQIVPDTFSEPHDITMDSVIY